MTRRRRGLVLLLGGLNQPNPATGTLYPALADGTYTWTLEQPTSPDPLTQLCGGFRVQSISSDGLGTVEDGWKWQLEYKNNTWTFSWYSVTGGTPAGAELTQTNIGTVTNVRVVLNGNSISVETSANNGSSYTSRGNTNSATYATETGLCSSYTGATGPQLLANPTFATWTGTYPNAAPVSWDLSGQTMARYVEQNVNGVRFISNEDFRPRINQTNVLSAGTVYIRIINLYSVTSGAVWTHDNLNGGAIYENASGVYAVRWTAVGTSPYISTRDTPADFVVSSNEIYVVGVLDNSGDGGISQVVAS